MPNFRQITKARAPKLQSQGALLLDVRSPREFAAGHLPGAKNLPHNQIATQIHAIATPNQPILLYCTTGQRSKSAATVLARLGYQNIYIIKA